MIVNFYQKKSSLWYLNDILLISFLFFIILKLRVSWKWSHDEKGMHEIDEYIYLK